MDSENYSYEVIVIDNQSSDNELLKFKNKYSNVKFVVNSGNNGFANGCNLGASLAKGSYFLFLNPDTFLKKNVLQRLLSTYKENEELAILSCLQVNEKGKYYRQYNSFPSFFSFFGINRAITRITKKENLDKKFRKKGTLFYPDWVTGAVVFISRNWFEKIEGWNEDYWMYLEDVDLCQKSISKGGKLAVSTETVICHKHGGSSRLNRDIEAITRSEVVISKHVYINNHFSGIKKFILHSMLIAGSLSEKLFLSLVQLPFSPSRTNLNLLILKNLLSYYNHVADKGIWLSKRSMNFQKSLN